jgi:hypothetical protein
MENNLFLKHFNSMELLQQSNYTAEIIRAIGSLWPLLLITVIIILLLIYKKGVSKFLLRFNKISGKTPVVELQLEASNDTKDIPKSNQDNIVTSQAPEVTPSEIVDEIANEEEIISMANVYGSLIKRDILGAQNALNTVNEKESDEDQRYINELLFLKYKYLFPKVDTIEEIKSKVTNAPTKDLKSKAFEYIGDIYLDQKKYDYAIQYYKMSLEEADKQIEIADKAAKLSLTFHLNSQKEKCLPLLYDIKLNMSEPKALSKIYLSIAAHFEKENDNLNRVLALEASTSLDPFDTSTLFSVAYEYGQPNVDMNILSLSHYETYLSIKPNEQSVLNNLAVSYGKLGMLGKGVEYYKKSSQLGNTLASSNLANKYIFNGFYEEANELLNIAKIKTDVHESVWASLKDLADKENKENEKINLVRQSGERFQLFLRRFSEKYFSENNISLLELNGTWMQKNGLLITLVKSNELYYEIKWGGDGYNYKIIAALANVLYVIGEGERSPMGGGIINRLNAFVSCSDDKTSIKILVYDKRDDFGDIYEFQKV